MVGAETENNTDDYSGVDKHSASTQNKHEATKLKWWGTKLADGYGDAVSRHKTRAHATGLADALRLSALRGVKRQKYLPSVALSTPQLRRGIAQVRRQIPFCLFHTHPTPLGIAFHLIFTDFANTKIAAIRMAKVET